MAISSSMISGLRMTLSLLPVPAGSGWLQTTAEQPRSSPQEGLPIYDVAGPRGLDGAIKPFNKHVSHHRLCIFGARSPPCLQCPTTTAARSTAMP